MTDATTFTSAREAGHHQTEALFSSEQQHQAVPESVDASPKEASRHHAAKTPFYARIERTTTCRAKRLGPAFSPSATRRIYPDEESSAGA
jgi:hypothetical protein